MKKTIAVLVVLLIAGVCQGEMKVNNQKGFFKDLSPFIGNKGRVRGITNNLTAFTGDMQKDNASAQAYVWTKKDGFKLLPFPDNATNSRGMAVSDDGQVVAGLALDTTINVEHSNDYVDGAVVWGQSKKPLLSTNYGVNGAHISGVSRDGKVVAGYSTLGHYDSSGSTVEFKGKFNGFKVIDGDMYYINGVYPQGDNGAGIVLQMTADGRKFLMGEEIREGRYILNDEGEKIKEFKLKDIPVEFPRGYVLGGLKMGRGRVWDIYAQVINHDATYAAGRLVATEDISELFFYFPIYWDNDGKIIFMNLNKSYMDYVPKAISDDGFIVLMSRHENTVFWRKDTGFTTLATLFKEYNINIGEANPSKSSYIYMSGDGKCIGGSIYYDSDKDYRPFIACFGEEFKDTFK